MILIKRKKFKKFLKIRKYKLKVDNEKYIKFRKNPNNHI